MSILIKCQLTIKLTKSNQSIKVTKIILDAVNGMRVHHPDCNQVLASSASVIPRAKIIVWCPLPFRRFELVAPVWEILDLEYYH